VERICPGFRKGEKRLSFILSILSAFLLAESLPPSKTMHLSWISFIPLFIALSDAKQRLRRAFLLGLINGIAFSAVVFYGIPNGMVFFGALIYFSFNISIFSMGITLVNQRAKRYSFLFPPLLWTSLEYVRTLGNLSFPTNLALTQYQSIPLIQIASITGISGVSFLIILVNSCLFKVWQYLYNWFEQYYFLKTLQKVKGSKDKAAKLLGVEKKIFKAKLEQDRSLLKDKLSLFLPLILVFILPISIIWWGKWKELIKVKEKYPFNVSIVQGSIPDWLYEIERWDEKYSRIVQKTYLRLTEDAVNAGSHLTIWPETTIHRRVMEIPFWKDKIIEFAKSGKTFMVAASSYQDEKKNKFNSIFVISPEGKIVGRYDKTRLVPIIEAHFKPGKDIKIIKTPIANLGIEICFESIYPSISRNLAGKGANLLIISTNDTSLKKTKLAYCHMANAVFRAVENRRFCIRAAQSGISMIIDSDGQILKQSELFKPIILNGKVKLRYTMTFYTRFGDIFCYLCILFSIILLSIAFGYPKST